ncbi:MAG: Flp family type IVb pilin [Acidimicrobiales bacterium]
MATRPDLSSESEQRPPGPDERGASLVEYALLLALIAIVCIGGVTLIGRATMDPLSSAASMFGG